MADRTVIASDHSKVAGPDPFTVLLSALSLPSSAAGPPSAGDVGLRIRLVQKFALGHPKMVAILAEYAEDPETYREPARKALREVGADRDQEVLDLATELLKQADRAQTGITGGVVGQINAPGGRVVAVGRDVSGPVIVGDVNLWPEAP